MFIFLALSPTINTLLAQIWIKWAMFESVWLIKHIDNLFKQWHWISLQVIDIRRCWIFVKTNFFNIKLPGKYYLDAMRPITAILTAHFLAWVPPWPQCARLVERSNGGQWQTLKQIWKQNLITCIWQIYWLAVENAMTPWYYSVNRVFVNC